MPLGANCCSGITSGGLNSEGPKFLKKKKPKSYFAKKTGDGDDGEEELVKKKTR